MSPEPSFQDETGLVALTTDLKKEPCRIILPLTATQTHPIPNIAHAPSNKPPTIGSP